MSQTVAQTNRLESVQLRKPLQARGSANQLRTSTWVVATGIVGATTGIFFFAALSSILEDYNVISVRTMSPYILWVTASTSLVLFAAFGDTRRKLVLVPVVIGVLIYCLARIATYLMRLTAMA